MAQKKTESKNIIPVICFSALAVILLIGCIMMLGMQDDKDPVQETEDTVTVTTTVDETENSQADITTVSETVSKQEPAETTPAHISPETLVFSENGSEVRDINIVLDKDKNKTYKLDLKDFAEDGDSINSFTFYFSSEDGESALGLTKGGFGISVSNDCPERYDNLWYQPDDFAVEGQGVHSSVTFEIPPSVQDYITISNGKVQFGYWWSDVQKVVLEKVVCSKYSLKSIPCDGEKTIPNGIKLTAAEPGNVITIPLKDIINENELIQSVSLKFTGSDPDTPCNISGEFGISTGTLFNGMYHSSIMLINSQNDKADCTWILPNAVLKSADPEGNLEFRIIESSVPEVTIDKMDIQWSVK